MNGWGDHGDYDEWGTGDSIVNDWDGGNWEYEMNIVSEGGTPSSEWTVWKDSDKERDKESSATKFQFKNI